MGGCSFRNTTCQVSQYHQTANQSEVNVSIDDNLGQTRYSIAPGPDENSSASAVAFFMLQQLLKLPFWFADVDSIQSEAYMPSH